MIGPLRNGTGMIVAPDPSIRPATASTLQIDIRDKRYPAVGDTPAHTAIRDLFLEVPCGQFVALEQIAGYLGRLYPAWRKKPEASSAVMLSSAGPSA
jgi:hypothetical protein